MHYLLPLSICIVDSVADKFKSCIYEIERIASFFLDVGK